MTQPTPAAPATVPMADSAHLLRVIETQPACLMRIGADGLILAANDAALALLGVDQPRQVLGKALTTWIVPGHQDEWRTFAETVTGGVSQSVECDLIDTAGKQRNVVFHGVPLTDHVDGIVSMIVGARDATTIRRLEAALHESEAARQRLVEMQSSAVSTAEQEELKARIQELEADRDQLESALAKMPQLEKLLKQGRAVLQDMRTKLDAAVAEREKLAAQLAEREAAHESLWAEQAELQQSLAERQSGEVRTLQEEHARALEGVQATLAAAAAARDDAAARLAERDARIEELERQLAEGERKIEALSTDFSGRDAAYQSLAAELADRDARIEALREQMAEGERQSAHRQTEFESRLAALAADIADRDNQIRAAFATLAERDTEIESARAGLAERDTQIQRALVTLADRELAAETAVARLAERQHAIDALTARIADHEQQLSTRDELQRQEAAAYQTTVANLQDELETLSHERDRFSARLSDAEAETEAVRAQLGSLRANLEAAAAERDQLSSDRDRLMAERERLAVAVAEAEAFRRQAEAAYDDDRARLSEALDAAGQQQRQSERALADQRLELQSLDVAIRTIEPLAAAGRLAADLAQELSRMLGDIDARTACLVADCAPDSTNREQIEQLRMDTVKAASLVRQMLQTAQLLSSEER